MKLSRELPVQISLEEAWKKATSLAGRVLELEALKDKMKADASASRARKKELQAEIVSLSTGVRTKTELRQVECEQRAADVNGAVETVRTDTGEVIETKAVNEHKPLFKGSTAEGKAARKKQKGPQPDPLDGKATGEPGWGCADDGRDYELTIEQADGVRTGKTVKVQGQEGVVEILKLAKPPTRKPPEQKSGEALQ